MSNDRLYSWNELELIAKRKMEKCEEELDKLYKNKDLNGLEKKIRGIYLGVWQSHNAYLGSELSKNDLAHQIRSSFKFYCLCKEVKEKSEKD